MQNISIVSRFIARLETLYDFTFTSLARAALGPQVVARIDRKAPPIYEVSEDFGSFEVDLKGNFPFCQISFTF